MRGHVTKRGDSWTAIVDLPPDPATGKRRQKRITARTKREVEQQVASLIQAGQTGFTDAGRLSVREFFDRWLETTAPTLRAVTRRRYRDLVRLHVVGVIGHVPLAKLTAADLQRLYADRLKVLSPTTVRYVHAVLHHALDDAVKWGLLFRNVVDAVEPPQKARTEMRVWDADQAGRVLRSAADDPLEALWRVAIYTGMRRGELLAVKWTDLDLDAGALFVQRSLGRGQTSRLEEGEPKSRSGRRRIALSPSVVDSLRRHRVRQLEHRLAAGEAYEDRGYVFANETGGHVHPNSLYRRFRALTERAGVPPIRFHDLRHTSATLLLAGGVHGKIVQERLGHSNIAMTLDLYSHVTADMQRTAADRLDALICDHEAKVAGAIAPH
ncbi:MAG: site-specific integrase [Chloroflexota bacterium]|nr:site-specific integrase [Chloroflexota bacterium]